jgi:TRAP-type C4-dicarboxylate transport system permease large subunit
VQTAITSAVVGAMIAFASVVTYMLTIDMLPQKLLVPSSPSPASPTTCFWCWWR